MLVLLTAIILLRLQNLRLKVAIKNCEESDTLVDLLKCFFFFWVAVIIIITVIMYC